MARVNNAGLMYGVKEHDRNRVIDSEYLEQNGLESGSQQLIRGHGYDFIYGVRTTLDDHKCGTCSPRHKKYLTRFLAAMKEKGIDFGEPASYFGVEGDYDVDAKWAFSDEIKRYSDLEWSDSENEDTSSEKSTSGNKTESA